MVLFTQEFENFNLVHSSLLSFTCLTIQLGCEHIGIHKNRITGCACSAPSLCYRRLASSMGDNNISSPTESTPPWPVTKNSVTADPRGSVKFGANPSVAGFCANRWNITIFYLSKPFLFPWTHLQVRPMNGFSRLTAQTTRTRTMVCVFWGGRGFVDIAFQFGVCLLEVGYL